MTIEHMVQRTAERAGRRVRCNAMQML
jgi:hypothetical protein